MFDPTIVAAALGLLGVVVTALLGLFSARSASKKQDRIDQLKIIDERNNHLIDQLQEDNDRLRNALRKRELDL